MDERIDSKKSPTSLKFAPEGYWRPDDPEFLDELKKKLEEEGIDTTHVVYHGFDASVLKDGKYFPRVPLAYGMNEAGWREALRTGEPCPADFTDKANQVPCIAVFDSNLLSEVFTSEIKESPQSPEQPMEVEVIKLNDALKDLGPDVPVDEEVVHVDYPDKVPADALICLVFIEDEPRQRDLNLDRGI